MKSSSAIQLLCVIAGVLGASSAMAQTDTTSDSTTDTTTSTTPSGGGSTDTTTSTTSSGGGSTDTTTSTTSSGGSGSGSTYSTGSTSSGSGTSTSTSTRPTSSSGTTTTQGTTSTGTTSSGTTSTGVAAPAEREQEGDGRDVDFIWLEAFDDVANVNLVAFNGSASMTDPATGTTVFNEVNGTGPMFGGALGFRVYWLAVGARTTFSSYSTFQIGTVGGEVALRFPIPVVEPYVRVGFGYAWQGDANYAITTAGVTTNPATTVYGWAFNAAVGIDIFLVNWFTIGAGVGLDVLNMTRQTDPRMPCMGLTDFCPGRGGDAVGYQLSGFGQIGFHI